MLRQLPLRKDKRLLVGTETADDAGVFQIDRSRAVVLTVDFFTPIVDDPFGYGQIAAANSLSDVYAMGGRPVTAMNVVGVPTDTIPAAVINAILRGGAEKIREAGCLLVGGHSIKSPEPFYGLSVMGFVHPRRVISNAGARPGDWLVLTKPLGTGIVTTAIKKGICPAPLARRVVRSMGKLNDVGATLAERGLVRAGTDITGFGLLGHLGSLGRASSVGAELWMDAVPTFGSKVAQLIQRDCVPGGTRLNLNTAEESTDWVGVDETERLLLADAQTSGGLLLCVAPRHLDAALDVLKTHRALAASVIGRIAKGPPRIRVSKAR